jgi:pyruvate/2-oxoacid:ferredoxin oxidoreductase alpha subunit
MSQSGHHKSNNTGNNTPKPGRHESAPLNNAKKVPVEGALNSGRKDAARQTKMVMKGNVAAAIASKLCRVGFVTAYPITPQTTIIEEIAAMIARGEFEGGYVNMESEHSVFAALMGASIAGERVFTATSGQGLLYAHEVLHAIAHMRLPIVACNVGRPSFPWNIWADQSDSVSQRDTGWVQYYCESSQEVLDTIIQSYRLAEKLLLPVMVVLDAFYLSHTSENVYVPDEESVGRFCPHIHRTDDVVDPDHPRSFGGLVDPSKYDLYNRRFHEVIRQVEDETVETGRDFGEQFGRSYGAVEAVNIHAGTRRILVTMASITTTARQVVAARPDVGLIKIRLFKPFPKKSIIEALRDVPSDCELIAVDRNFTGDSEGALLQELKRALYGQSYALHGVYAGLGGRDVPPRAIENILSVDFGSKTSGEVSWID